MRKVPCVQPMMFMYIVDQEIIQGRMKKREPRQKLHFPRHELKREMIDTR